MSNTKLTSIKLLTNIYKQFKILGVQEGVTLQKVVNRSLYLYLNDLKFRDRVDTVDELEVSGSNF